MFFKSSRIILTSLVLCATLPQALSSAIAIQRRTDGDQINVLNPPLGGATCIDPVGDRNYQFNHVVAVIQDAAARFIDGRTVPNPKNKNNNNPYPHIYGDPALTLPDGDCANGRGKNLYEYPILVGDGLFDENSPDVGNDRVFFLYTKGTMSNGELNAATFCTVGTHTGAPGPKKFTTCKND